MNERWQYQKVLENNNVENKFDNFMRYLVGLFNKKGKRNKHICALGSDYIQLEFMDCALVYNPYISRIKLHSKLILEESSERTPQIILMAILAHLILDKDPEFESLIAKKTAEYLELFEKDRI